MQTDLIKKPSKFTTFKLSNLARPAVIILLIGIALIINSVVGHFKANKYAAAHNAADTFLTAYSNCDVQTAEQYYPLFQTDATAVQHYKQQCVKGAIHIKFDSNNSYTEKSVKGINTIKVSLIYNLSQKSGTPTKVIVNMQWSSDKKHWTVAGISAAPAANANGAYKAAS